jgi:energy-coupling factor transporter transmembrane protein EcfT
VATSDVLALLAAQPSLADKLRRVPTETWIQLLITVFAIFVVIRVWKGLRQINEFVPYLVAGLTCAVLFLLMVYNRNEPRFLTPLVERMTHFFPTKSAQEQRLDQMRKNRD